MEKDRLLKLVEAYQEHFKQYNRPDYNETALYMKWKVLRKTITVEFYLV